MRLPKVNYIISPKEYSYSLLDKFFTIFKGIRFHFSGQNSVYHIVLLVMESQSVFLIMLLVAVSRSTKWRLREGKCKVVRGGDGATPLAGSTVCGNQHQVGKLCPGLPVLCEGGPLWKHNKCNRGRAEPCQRATAGTVMESRWRLWPSLGEKYTEGMENVCKIFEHHWDTSWCIYKSQASVCQWFRLVLMKPNYPLSSLEILNISQILFD